MAFRLINADCVQAMQALPDCSIDAIVTDPPYGLSPDGKARTWDDITDGRARGGFMGKAWDSAVPGVTWARQCLRVLKPGAHLIAFGGTRTIHRLTCAVEDAGFDVRDMLTWQYYSGFPKSLNVSIAIDKAAGAVREDMGPRRLPNGKAHEYNIGFGEGDGFKSSAVPSRITAPATDDAKRWAGWGTAVKPAYEPAVLARKPLIGTVAHNVLTWGTGALNIDACRYAYGDPAWPGPSDPSAPGGKIRPVRGAFGSEHDPPLPLVPPPPPHALGRFPANIYACPKPSRAEREQGCGHLAPMTAAEVTDRRPDSAGAKHARSGMTRTGNVHNTHPTVKPIGVMLWLCKLITPIGGTVLDPFTGSGTTGIAALRAGFDFIGIEREPDYVTIARARIVGDNPLFNIEAP